MKPATKLNSNFTIGGSEVAAAIGVSPWVTQRQLYLRKLGLEPPTPDNDRFRAGRIAEAYIAELAGVSGETQEKIQIGSASASIDIINFSAKKIYEFKTASLHSSEELPVQYQLQVLWYLGLAKIKYKTTFEGELITLTPDFSIKRHVVKYDKKTFDLLDKKIGEFIEKYLIPQKEPEPQLFEYSQMVPTATWVQLADDLYPKLEKAREIKASIKKAEDALKKIEDEIKMAIGNASEGRFANGEVVSWKGYERASFDAKKLKEEHPKIFEKYNKISNYRIFKY